VKLAEDVVEFLVGDNLSGFYQKTCGLDFSVSLKQIQMWSQGAFVRERRDLQKMTT